MATLHSRYPAIKEAQVEVLDVTDPAPTVRQVFLTNEYDSVAQLQFLLNQRIEDGWSIFKIIPYPAVESIGYVIFERWDDVDNQESTAGSSKTDSKQGPENV